MDIKNNSVNNIICLPMKMYWKQFKNTFYVKDLFIKIIIWKILSKYG